MSVTMQLVSKEDPLHCTELSSRHSCKCFYSCLQFGELISMITKSNNGTALSIRTNSELDVNK